MEGVSNGSFVDEEGREMNSPIRLNHPKFRQAVSTSKLRSLVTDEVTKRLEVIGDELIKEKYRVTRKERLTTLIKESDWKVRKFLESAFLREEQHRSFMNLALKECSPMKKWKLHDYTKDDLFFFVLASFFDGKASNQSLTSLKDHELERHYNMESHHPEFEKYGDNECDFDDIFEMALDRISRNLQFGNGLYDEEIMKKYIPTFYRGDLEHKKKLFLYCVRENYEKVEHLFAIYFPNTPNWRC